MCDTHAYTPRPVCTPRYTKRDTHSCEIHVIDIDGQSFTTNGRYRLPRLHRLQNAPMRIARIGAGTPSAKTNCMYEKRYIRARRSDIVVHAYACNARIHIDFCQGYNVHVRLSRSVIDDRFAVKRRNLDVEIIGSAAFSICSKLSRSRDGRPKNASTRLSNSIEWIARSTSRTHSRFDERLGAFRKIHVVRTKTRN